MPASIRAASCSTSTTAEFDRIFAINLRAPFILTRELATQMIAQGREGLDHQHLLGRLAQDAPTVVPYCTSKTALDRLTKGFAHRARRVRHPRERARAGLRRRQHGQRPHRGAYRRAPIAQIPLGRPSSREDVGNGLLYLASDASAYVTGATLTIDGGNSIGSLAVHQDKKNPL